MKILLALIATAFFMLLLVGVYYIHANYFRVNVVFYSALADGLLATSMTAVLLLTVKTFRIFNHFEKSLLILIWLMSSYSFAISVPTVIDRSLSIYILEKLHQRGGGIKQDSLERVFTQEYMKEYRLVDVRLTEQLESGTIVIEDGCVILTPKGEFVVALSSYFREHWLPKQRLLVGGYSDSLIDPFKNSLTISDYACTKK